MKKEKTAFKYYNNGEITKRFYNNEIIPDGWKPGVLSKLGKPSWNKGLDITDPRVKKNAANTKASRIRNGSYKPWNKGLTKETDSRIKGNSGELNPMFGRHRIAWNKGLTKEDSPIIKQISDGQKGRKAWNKGLFGFNDERIQRGFETRKNNGTLNTSKPEEDFYKFLCNIYGEENILRLYKSEKYPFNCDFYIKPRDLYIELNLFWTHGYMKFDKNNQTCIKLLEEWVEKSKHNLFYKSAIHTWTITDPLKFTTAEENKLNYLTIYNKEQLQDFYIKNANN